MVHYNTMNRDSWSTSSPPQIIIETHPIVESCNANAKKIDAYVENSVYLSVNCKDDCMFGKYMKDINIPATGKDVVMKPNRVVRFRESDGYLSLGDVYVGMGRHNKVTAVHQEINQRIANDDPIIHGIGFRFDNTMNFAVLYFYILQ